MAGKTDLKALYNEPACAKSSAERKAACEKPEPGSSAAGCAFHGAYAALRPFTDCAHIVHSPATCKNVALGTNPVDGTPAHTVFCTDIKTNDLIFGGDEKLRSGVDTVFDRLAPKAIFLYATCVSALIGEDFDAVAREKEQELGIPVIPIHAPGFVGNDFFGAKVAGVALLEAIIGRKEPETTTPLDINLLGAFGTPEQMQSYTRLLEKLGVRVLGTFGAESPIGAMMCAHRAKLNVIVSSNTLITLARKMKERWKIPWVNVGFHGCRDTSDALRAIAQGFGDPLLLRKVEQIIAEEEQKLRDALAPLRVRLKKKKALLNAEGEKTWRYVSLLNDTQIDITAVSIDKATDSDIETAQSYLFGRSIFMKEPDAEQEALIGEHGVDILLSEFSGRGTALRHNIAFMDIDAVDRADYLGYEGSVRFCRDLVRAVESPAFGIVRKEVAWM